MSGGRSSKKLSGAASGSSDLTPPCGYSVPKSGSIFGAGCVTGSSSWKARWSIAPALANPGAMFQPAAGSPGKSSRGYGGWSNGSSGGSAAALDDEHAWLSEASGSAPSKPTSPEPAQSYGASAALCASMNGVAALHR